MKTAPPGLFGRDREIAGIEAMLAGAADSAGSVVVVSAGTGMGKTALLGAAVQRARRGGFTVLAARGSSAERDLPFGLLTRLFEPVARECAASGIEIPALGPDREASHAELSGLHHALARLASGAPVLVAVDDLQWLDRQSLRWLSTVPRRADHARIAVMVTVCPGEPSADPAVLDELLAASAVQLHPAALGLPAASALLERSLGTAPDDAFAAAFLRVSGGNPLVAGELSAALGERGIKPTADAADALEAVAVPRLAPVVHARLRRISPYALEVARSVAVFGEEADLGRVTAVVDARPEQVAEVVTALGRAGVLRAAEGSAHAVRPDEPLGFAQPLLRATVVHHIPFADLRALRTRAARALRTTGAPDSSVADQLLATSGPAEPWAAALLRNAAAAALRKGAPGTAVAYLRRALDEPLPDTERAWLTTELGRAEGRVDIAAAIRHLTSVSAPRAAPEVQPGVVRELAELLAVTGRHAAAVELLGGTTDPPSADRLLYAAELQSDHAASAEGAAELLARLPKPVPNSGVNEGRYLSLLAIRAVWAGRSRTRAVALAKQSLAALPVAPDTVRPVLRGIRVLGHAGRAEDAYERCDALVAHAERWQHRPALAAARSLRGAIAHRLGRMRAAADDARAALDLLTGCGAPRQDGAAVEFLARLVEVLVDSGECDEAAGLLELSELCGDVPDTSAGTALLLARGRLRVTAGHPAEGVRDLLAAGNRMPSPAAGNPAVASWRSEAAAALLKLGESAEARRQAADAVDEARRWGAAGPLGAALRTLGLAVGGSRGLVALEESVSVLERSGDRLHRARSLAEYGTALSRADRPVPARRALRAALELAEQCGSAELAERSRIELSASGGRPPRSSRAEGVAALTAAELRTAMLAAEGKTNRELADVLVVRQRTVEIHLTNAYRKLGIEGRDQLPSVLHVGPDAAVSARTGSR